MTRKYNNSSYIPSKCWVGDGQKISYPTREEAEVAARVAEYDHHIKLEVYKCEYGDHWHLTSINFQKNKHKRS
ncbi:hypothetical protein IJI91_01485 [Candidatus Saccharibacteria bacterium]|nr:hypothetical protein [Candidatus Saccharibacteria bacterium]MBR0460646.1 hypothetical protein [Candidatus Saccharibacteria bacterium]